MVRPGAVVECCGIAIRVSGRGIRNLSYPGAACANKQYFRERAVWIETYF